MIFLQKSSLNDTHGFYRVVIKNIGGGKHQLIFNRLELGDMGEISCKSGDLTSSCFLEVKKGEEKPMIRDLDDVEAPVTRPIAVVIPYKGENFSILDIS